MRTRASRFGNVLSTIALLLAITIPLQAHGGGVIKVTPSKPGVGSDIGISGTGFDKAAALKLELRGTLATLALTQIRTDAKGNFRTTLALPAEARAGAYSLVAIAADGDVAARVSLAIVGRPAESDMRQAMGNMPQEMAKPHGAGEMKLAVPQSAPQTAGVLLFLVLCFAAGVWLLLTTPSSEV